MLNTSYPYYPVADADAIILLMLLLVSFNTDYVDDKVYPCIVYISYTQSRVHMIRGPRLLVITHQKIELELKSEGAFFQTFQQKAKWSYWTNTYLLTLKMQMLPTNTLYPSGVVSHDLCLFQTCWVVLNVNALVTAENYVEVVRFTSDVVKKNMTAKAAIKIKCVKIARVITCHPRRNVLSE